MFTCNNINKYEYEYETIIINYTTNQKHQKLWYCSVIKGPGGWTILQISYYYSNITTKYFKILPIFLTILCRNFFCEWKNCNYHNLINKLETFDGQLFNLIIKQLFRELNVIRYDLKAALELLLVISFRIPCVLSTIYL